MVAVRLQFDVMGVECIVVARTDSEAATLLTSNIDSRDHPFIIGSTNEAAGVLNDIINAASLAGKTADEIGILSDEWNKNVYNLIKYSPPIYTFCKNLMFSSLSFPGFLQDLWRSRF